MKSKNNITLSIVQNYRDFRKVVALRRKVFVEGEGYPSKTIVSDFDQSAIHILAKDNDVAVGTISLVLDSDRGLPIDKKFDLRAFRAGKVVEINKFAVLPDKRGSTVAFDLMCMSYAIARFLGAQKMFIFTLKKRVKNILLYKKFGFKLIGECMLFDNEMAVIMVADYNEENTYEKRLNNDQILTIARKLFGMTVMGENK